MTRKPVHIITGFLGAGKTTFLNHFIREQLPERIFVIENECGATNIDGALVMDGVEEIVELTAGCLCCSLADGLLDILEEAHNRRDQYDRMVIETTGVISFRDAYDTPRENSFILSTTGDLNEAARNIFKALRAMDRGHIKVILTELLPEEGLGRAINDRLRRAAAK